MSDDLYMEVFTTGYYQGFGNGLCDALLALLLFLILGITVFVLFRKGRR